MRINVKAKPGAGHQKIEKIDEDSFVVAVKAPPTEGKANRAIIKALAEYFDVAPTRVRIIFGHIGREKVIEII